MVNGSGTCSNIFVPDEVKKVIYNQHSPIAFCNEEDKPIWTHSHTGKVHYRICMEGAETRKVPKRHGQSTVAPKHPFQDVLNKKFGRAIFGDNWITICQACDYKIQQKEVIIVKWIRPHFDTLKLNSDGSCVNNICGGGGIVRDSIRKIIFAYSILLGPGTTTILNHPQ
ncbi:hypothetical protein EJD97_012461 [Solanum chilense]|uniref:RNase H type-1 domain-containing protein n=1 Tax=Solanum chilense TaxID=4083 RepID=A0A6N2CGQ7_SOLCI|nr:hypothetical protein EJD97_012461 [Solanum chilense]